MAAVHKFYFSFLLLALVYGDVRYMTCVPITQQHPSWAPVASGSSVSPVRGVTINLWKWPVQMINNVTRTNFLKKIYPGMPFYNHNAPRPTTFAPISAPAVSSSPAKSYAPNAINNAAQFYILTPTYYNNSYKINAVRSNGVILTANYSYYVPNENLTITLGNNWRNLLRAEGLIALNETNVPGGNIFLQLPFTLKIIIN